MGTEPWTFTLVTSLAPFGSTGILERVGWLAGWRQGLTKLLDCQLARKPVILLPQLPRALGLQVCATTTSYPQPS